MKFVSVILIILVFCVFYGCSPKVISPTDQQIGPPQTQQKDSTTDEKDSKKRAGITEEDLTPQAERDRLRRLQELEKERGFGKDKKSLFSDIHFEYDSYAIKEGDLSRLKEVSNWLKQHKNTKVAIEGHCDERGTNEYNLALGQKRADAVKDYLVKLGVDEKQVSAISYGKEVPANLGHNEEAWATNRRAHINLDEKG
jgi:peptidoglycan-associated lipoprotein